MNTNTRSAQAPSSLWARFFRAHVFVLPGLALVLALVLPSMADELYAQPPFTTAELNKLIDDLPRFRAWIKVNKETAHPTQTAGKPDFLYSTRAAEQVTQLGWEPRRFFCVMGRAAAALAIIEQGTELTDTPPLDMPRVSSREMDAVRHNLTGLLQAVARPVDGAATQPPKPTLSDKATGNAAGKALGKMSGETSGKPLGKE